MKNLIAITSIFSLLVLSFAFLTLALFLASPVDQDCTIFAMLPMLATTLFAPLLN